MTRRLLGHLAILAVAVTVSACGGGGADVVDRGLSAPAALPAAPRPGPQTFSVQVDGRADAFSGAFTAFFPDQLSVHPGDTVTVTLPYFSGQPHTVTMGTLVDAAVAKLQTLGPAASLAAQEDSPEMLHLPDVYAHQVTGGFQDANQSAAQPCFLDAGIPPLSLTGGAPACPTRQQPAFNGTQTFYNSGVLNNAGAAFSVPIATTTRPGTYSLMCLMHRSAGIAQISVVSADQPVPTPAQAATTGQEQLRRLVDVLKPVAAKADQATPDAAVAGAADPSVYTGQVAEFGPKTIAIPVGGTATWQINGFHTISFGAQDKDVGSLVRAPDGSIHLNPNGNSPAGFQVPDAAFAFPPPDNGRPLLIDGGRWDGSGFRSTGLVASFAPAPITVRQTFTKPGTYAYRCLFHPAMYGEVRVG